MPHFILSLIAWATVSGYKTDKKYWILEETGTSYQQKKNYLYWQSGAKYLEQCKEIKKTWTGVENFEYCPWLNFYCSCQKFLW